MSVPRWLADITVEQLVTLIAGLSALGFLALRAWRGLRKIMRFIDDMNGAPARPGVMEKPGVLARLSTIEGGQTAMADQVKVIHHEVLPNDGESLRDEVNRNTEGIKAAHDRIDDLDKRLDQHINQSRETP